MIFLSSSTSPIRRSRRSGRCMQEISPEKLRWWTMVSGLPSAKDNRPLNFEEFESKIDQILFVSATPGQYEAEHELLRAEQIIRPTGLLDPKVEVRPVEGQIDDLIGEVNKEVEKGNKVLITTLTKAYGRGS